MSFAYAGNEVNTCNASIECNFENNSDDNSVTVTCPEKISTVDNINLKIQGDAKETAEKAYIPEDKSKTENKTGATLQFDESSQDNCIYGVLLFEPLTSATKEKALQRKLKFNYISVNPQPPSSAQ